MKCTVANKTIFTKKDAQAFIKQTKREVLRAYPCGHCKGWHLTKRINSNEAVPRGFLNNPIQHENDFKKYL